MRGGESVLVMERRVLEGGSVKREGMLETRVDLGRVSIGEIVSSSGKRIVARARVLGRRRSWTRAVGPRTANRAAQEARVCDSVECCSLSIRTMQVVKTMQKSERHHRWTR